MSRRTRYTGVVASVLLLAGLVVAVPPPAGAATSSTGTFTPLTPTRLLDTRAGTGAPEAPVAAGGVVTLTVDGQGGVPASGVSAVVLNVTATQETSNGYLTVYPDGVTRPLASNLNFVAGRSVPNLVIAPVGTDGAVDLYNGSAGTVELVADVSGYFTGGGTPADGTFTTLTPTRLLDTRAGTGAPEAPVAAGGVVTLTVDGQGGVPASGVSAVVLNVTATQETSNGYLTVYPDGVTRPLASNLNFVAGRSVPNLVIAPVGADGAVDLSNGSAGTVELVADVSGYFTGAATSALRGLTSAVTGPGAGAPRAEAPLADGPAAPVAAQSDIALQVDGVGGVPATGVSAVVLNVTATQPTANGYLTVYPDGTTRPLASNLNFSTGQTVPNLVIAPVGADGDVDLYNGSLGTVQLVADVSGYFLSSDRSFAPLTPSRLLDTRNGTGTGGSISGTVEDTSADGLAGVVVTAFADGTAAGTATTAADGTYTITDVDPGSYDVCFDAAAATGGPSTTGYADQCWDGATWDGVPGDLTGGTPVAVTGGSTTPGVDASLVAGGAVTGAVTDTSSDPLDGVDVEVLDAGGSELGSATTAADGTYTVDGLAAGHVDVCFDGSSATGGTSTTGYLDQCWDDVAWDGVPGDRTGGTSVPVAGGGATPDIDASLAAGGTISGTVTDTSSDPLDGAGVQVFDDTGTELGTATTASNGTYTVAGLATGTYDVCFDGSTATGGISTTGYLDQCYGGAAGGGQSFADFFGLTGVPVTVGSAATGIGASLIAGGAITGTVADSSGHGLGGVAVDLFEGGGGEISSATTGPDGTYSVTGVAAGAYDVCFDTSGATGVTSPSGYLDQCYDHAAWDGDPFGITGAVGVEVTAGATTPGIDAALAAGGAITGTVTDSGDHPLDGVDVEVLDAAGNTVGSGAVSTSNGRYVITGLEAGAYDVCFDASSATGGTSATGYLDQCWGGVVWDGSSSGPPGGTVVEVTVGSTTAGIDAALGEGGAISGTVTGPGGHPLAGVTVEISDGEADADGLVDTDGSTTASDGTYAVTGLAAGTYDVCFDASSATGGTSATGYTDQCWNGTSWDGFGFGPTGATGVTVAVGATATGIDAPLSAGGAVSGTVDGVGGHPLGGVEVEVGDSEDGSLGLATTSADGTYTVTGLATGTYDVCFDASSATGGPSATGYTDQCWDDVAWDGGSSGNPTGTSVAVAVGSTTTGIDASLTVGGAVSGTVTGAGGHGLAGVGVEVWGSGPGSDGDVSEVGDTTTSADGTYSVAGLAAGTYDVCFDASWAVGGASTTGYVDQCYDGAAWDGEPDDSPSATGVTVTAGATRTDVGASLATGALISGTVTDTDGRPIGGASVEVSGTNGDESEATTAPDGAYAVTGLAAGTYDVCFDASSVTGGLSTTGYLDQCYDDVPWDAGSFDNPPATDVAVTTGSTRSGVDASLSVGGAVSGTVTDGDGHPLVGVLVYVATSGGFSLGSTGITGSDGRYTVTGLATGTYDVCFDAGPGTGGSSTSGYLGQCYDGVAWDGIPFDLPPATGVAVTAGSTTSGADGSLAAAGAIAGTVTDAADHPLDGVTVDVVESGGVDSATTGPDGTYALTGLATGTYDVCFDASSATGGSSATGYASQCYDGVAWDDDPSDFPPATGVAVTAGSTRSGIDGSLADGGAISGTITDSADHPLVGVYVDVIDGSGDEVGDGGVTGPDGTYSVTGLSPGSYDVCFDASSATGGSSTTGYADRCWNGAAWGGDPGDTSGASAVSVTDGSTRAGIGAALPAAP